MNFEIIFLLNKLKCSVYLFLYIFFNKEKNRILWSYRRGKFSKSISAVREEYPNEIFSKKDLSFTKAFPPEGI